ncbi:NAD-dependent epimerase/dehydratase family protein [Fodinibius sediminis]|nr:NAD(P)-dependent oxidoreductase [Fodinibius sediminis]
MEKVIVTGATGFIGRQTLPFLQRRGFDIHALTSRGKTGKAAGNATWHQVDIFDYERVRQLCMEVKAEKLLHLAWYDVPGDRMSSPENLAWVGASLHLVRSFIENGGQKIVQAGSCAEYDWRYGYCRERFTPTDPESFYGECKASLNKVVEGYCRQKGVHFASGRIFFVYGPHESENRLVAHVIKSLLAKRQASLTHSNQIRDYLHVADVAGALVALLASNVEGAVNIASGRPIVLRSMVDMIGRKLNAPEFISYGKRGNTKDRHPVVFADVNRLSKEVGWRPTYSLDDGIDATIDWWKENQKITMNNY